MDIIERISTNLEGDLKNSCHSQKSATSLMLNFHRFRVKSEEDTKRLLLMASKFLQAGAEGELLTSLIAQSSFPGEKQISQSSLHYVHFSCGQTKEASKWAEEISHCEKIDINSSSALCIIYITSMRQTSETILGQLLAGRSMC